MPWRLSRNGHIISDSFDHNNVAALALDPNDSSSDTLWAGTGEPNACGSGCTAGVGLYLTTNGGDSWKGPIGVAQFAGRAVGSIAVQPGQLERRSSPLPGAASSACRTPAAAASMRSFPGAPHFGLYRSTERRRTAGQLVNQGAPALCTGVHP